jgi:protein-L-isoaspartate(D-aspartate) O-methyltransferase
MEQSAVEQARFNMIHQQIRPWEVLDRRVLQVLTAVPRERFVPDELAGLAFADAEVPIGSGQSMMAPKVEARMLQALDVQPSDRILEIGTGSGYVTACLARLGGRVRSLEILPELLEQARARLADMEITNVELMEGDGLAQMPADELFDAIAVTGSLPVRQPHLREHLRSGGRLFVVVGQSPVMQALLITRVGKTAWREEVLFETELPPLINAPQPKRFDF